MMQTALRAWSKCWHSWPRGNEIQQADPPQPYIDRALAWLASIEDELDTMNNTQLWGRFFGWLEAQR